MSTPTRTTRSFHGERTLLVLRVQASGGSYLFGGRAQLEAVVAGHVVLAAGAEADAGAAHGDDRDVSREDDEVRPRDGVAVLELDRPQNPQRLRSSVFTGKAKANVEGGSDGDGSCSDTAGGTTRCATGLRGRLGA